jgi:hypothetical protein
MVLILSHNTERSKFVLRKLVEKPADVVYCRDHEDLFSLILFAKNDIRLAALRELSSRLNHEKEQKKS